MRVLVCDDQADVVEAMRFLLKGAGHQFDSADSPASLLEKVESRGPYDAILMDMNYARDTTSGAEGLDLINRLRTRHAHTPVIVMTAWSSVDLAVEALQRGASDFIQKPWDNAKVLALLAKHVDQNRTRQHSEIEIARNVQQRLFPSRGNGVSGVEYDGLCVPAREIGGDYYDFLHLPGGQFGFVLADVSGKGIPAALLMANLQASFRSQTSASLDEILTNVNRLFYRSTPPEQYASAFLGVYNPSTKRLQYANCGHPAGLLSRASGPVERLETTATVLGILEDFATEPAEVTLAPGDTVVLYSDGITEAGIEAGDEFGIERVAGLVRQNQGRPLTDLVNLVARAAEDFAGGLHGDDMTLVGVRAAE
jgi:sigma-B regulation protein RsbU (phosphoserine phosphatase)